MAPSRKKKKPVSNPARGFATTSIVSKSKFQEPEAAVGNEVEHFTDAATEQEVSIPSKVVQNPSVEKEFHELTGDELERRLEESELQLLVEKYGDKVKKDAFRQVSRLQTERRLLRSHALPLSTSRWLPEEIIDLMSDHLKQQIPEIPMIANVTSHSSSKAIRTDDMSIRFWTLRRTLLDLGFLQTRVDEVISQLMTDTLMRDRADLASAKEGLWAVEECLDWLALSCTADELPGYESHRTEVAEKLLQQSDLESSSAFDTPITTPSLSRAATPPQSSFLTKSSEQDTFGKQEEPPPQVDEVADDDLSPRETLDRYLDLKARLHRRRPDLTVPALRSAKGAKVRSNGGSEKSMPIDPQSSRLLTRIRKIERDILFDKEEAHDKWMTIRVELIRETTERKRLGIDAEPQSESAISCHEKNAEQTSLSLSLPNGDHDTIDLGDFFSTLPNEEANTDTGRSSMTVTDTDGASVTIRNFGKWSGMGPRRVFEEACRARDSTSKISFSRISSSNFSSRHSLTVRWTKAQDIPVAAFLSGFKVQADSRNIKVEMLDISTPDVIQSEAFVSTVALFLIFSGSPKEEKTHLRLPAVWKDLWDELSETRKQQLIAADCEELRCIRQMVEATENETENKELSLPTINPKDDDIKANCATDIKSRVEIGVVDATALSNLWATKASSPAYNEMLKSRMTLPIWNYKSELLQAIESHQVIIVCGETGCGKSTQLPAYVLENELSNGRSCKIYCTEPRRISAISLARRVSEELGERKSDVGTMRSIVGYAIRLENHVTPQNRLVYATTGIVMRMLEGGNELREITHLVLDEVHERTIDSDFLLIVLRKLMVRRPELKVILMSATVNAEQFSKYLDGAPIMNVPGRTFPVDTKYLEDAIEVTNYGSDRGYSTTKQDEDGEDGAEGNSDSTAKSDLSGYNVKTRNTLAQFNEFRIDYELIVRLLETIARRDAYSEYSKAILVFLPGIAEIRALNDMLGSRPAFSYGWYIYPLHSTIATEEQERAFLVPPKGIRKIVLATNIAETGITIPDVTCVIDTGKHKEMRFDEKKQLSRLLESFISRANAKQRRGRAGRVQNGLCFHLFTKARHDSSMLEQQTPELLRLSLQDLVLRVKICNLGPIMETLSLALDPPLPKNVRRAIDALIDVKALTTTEDLTPLGRQLAKLPLDVFLGKLVILGAIYGCLDGMLTIAAILTSKSPFTAPIGQRQQADLAKLAFRRGDSDLLTVLNAYCSWRRVCVSTSAAASEYQFCRKNYLSPQTLGNIEDLKAQLTAALMDAGFLKLNDSENAALNRARFSSRQRHFVEIPAAYDHNSTNDLILNSVIAWSFYPKLLARDGKGWRNVANNQMVSLYPTSVNKGIPSPPKWLSYYHIMQSSNKFYNAHETSSAEDFAIALVCGDAEFKMYSGIIVIDGNRLRFAVTGWKVMLALKTLRMRLRESMILSFRTPGRTLSGQEQGWFDIWTKIFFQELSQRQR